MDPWICPKCRYKNPERDRLCGLCASLRPSLSPSARGDAPPSPASAQAPPPADPGAPSHCHFLVCAPYPPLRLHAAFAYTIGRERDNHICLPAKIVSRYHAVLRQKNGTWVLSDQRSANGVFVNGKRIQEIALRDKDRIRIGTFTITFREVPSANFHASALESKERETETLVIDENLVRRMQEGWEP